MAAPGREAQGLDLLQHQLGLLPSPTCFVPRAFMGESPVPLNTQWTHPVSNIYIAFGNSWCSGLWLHPHLFHRILTVEPGEYFEFPTFINNTPMNVLRPTTSGAQKKAVGRVRAERLQTSKERFKIGIDQERMGDKRRNHAEKGTEAFQKSSGNLLGLLSLF